MHSRNVSIFMYTILYRTYNIFISIIYDYDVRFGTVGNGYALVARIQRARIVLRDRAHRNR